MSDTPTTPTAEWLAYALALAAEIEWEIEAYGDPFLMGVKARVEAGDGMARWSGSVERLREDLEIAARARGLPIKEGVHPAGPADDPDWIAFCVAANQAWNNARAAVLGADGVAEGHQP